jgi:competence protein ComEC
MTRFAPSPRPWPAVLGLLALAALLLALLLPVLLGQPQPAVGDAAARLAPHGPAVETSLTGRLATDPRRFDDGSCRVLLQLPVGASELQLQPCQELQEGWRVQARGRLRRPAPAPHPLLSGAAERLARQGAFSQLRVEQLRVLERPATPVASLRRRIARQLVERAGPERGGLLAALVLGSAVVPLPAALTEAFRAAGLSHALAASGFHLTVLLGAVLLPGRHLSAAGRLALAGGAMVLFLLLAGPQPSVLRAVLMAALVLLIKESGHQGRPLAILALTVVLMLLLRPRWLLDVGFQLSVAATAGLLLSAGPLEQALAARLPPGRAGRWLAGAIAVPLAASLWTLPLQLLHFGALPLYAVPANMAAAPLLTPLTLGAMAAAVAAVAMPPLLPVLLLPLDHLARLLGAIASGFAALPMAQWQTGRPAAPAVLLLAVALLVWLLPDLARPWRRLAWLPFALAVALHLGQLTGDQLLLVHQGQGSGGRDLLLARHRGRAALVASHADPWLCRQSRQLAAGLGVPRLDWALLLDPVASADPACWQALAGRVVAYGSSSAPLLAGQRLSSPGLAVTALSNDSHGLELQLGRRRWRLYPDRQSLAADRRRGDPPRHSGLWLGGAPQRKEQTWLRSQVAGPVWISGPRPRNGADWPRRWQTTGPSGFLHSAS